MFELVDIEELKRIGCNVPNCDGTFYHVKWTSCASTTVCLCEEHWRAVRAGHLTIRRDGDAWKCTRVENPEQDPSTYPLQRGEPDPGERN